MTGRRLRGKKALVTGAARGLGATIARMLAVEGADVMATDIDGNGVGNTADGINALAGAGTAHSARHDVTDESRWREVVVETEAALGGLDILVNNAGIVILGSIEDLSAEDWRRSMSVNTDSIFYGCRAALPAMRRRQPASIINISSIAGLIAGHNLAAYNASKAAVWLLTKSIALHCARARLDIRCNSIHPSFIRTPMLGELARGKDEDRVLAKFEAQLPIGRLGEAEDVGHAVVYLASDESRFMTGAELKLDGGVSAM